MEPHDLDPVGARDLLARLDASSAATRSAMRRDRHRHARFAAFVGVAMGAYLIITMLFVQRAVWLWALALVLYVGGIVVMCWRFNRLRVSAPPAWQRRYRNGVIGGMVFYVGGIVLNTAVVVPHDWSVSSTLVLAVPLTALTVAPLAYVALQTWRDDA
jgi:hypothetical protein